jgi:hypothetical protein
MPAPFQWALAADIDDLDTNPIPMQPQPGTKPVSRTKRKPSLSGASRTKGKEGRELKWAVMDMPTWAFLNDATGGDSRDSATRYVRSPIYRHGEATAQWGDYLAEVEKPDGTFDDTTYEQWRDITVVIRNMTLIQVSA